jgi:hypothetical protein
MRKYLPVIIGVALLLIIALVVATSRGASRRFDDRVTLKEKDKIPFGTSAVRTVLPALFSRSDVRFENGRPGNWNEVISTSYNQAVFLVSDHFNADMYELGELLRFVEKGNYVFIVAHSFSSDAREIFAFREQSVDTRGPFVTWDTLGFRLQPPSFASDSLYLREMVVYDSWLSAIDTNYATVLGRNVDGAPNFVRMNRGSGSVFIHTSPLAFSNFFVLAGNNFRYIEQVLSVVPAGVEKVSWNEFYLTKPRTQQDEDEDKEPSWLSVLLRYPAFRWGLITAAATALLMVVLGMRRRQRMIPGHQKPVNESLDFVRTMGRLYYDRRNHHNLARKMAQYFLEHVRNQYKLATHSLDEEFVRMLGFKSGYAEARLTDIVSFIQALDTKSSITEVQLAKFHRQLEDFYQNT